MEVKVLPSIVSSIVMGFIYPWIYRGALWLTNFLQR